jgi:hypothetical protein
MFIKNISSTVHRNGSSTIKFSKDLSNNHPFLLEIIYIITYSAMVAPFGK